MTVRLKACKRCGGDMSYEIDIYGRFRQCLQCSNLEDLASEAVSAAVEKHGHVLRTVAAVVNEDSVAKEASDAR